MSNTIESWLVHRLQHGLSGTCDEYEVRYNEETDTSEVLRHGETVGNISYESAGGQYIVESADPELLDIILQAY